MRWKAVAILAVTQAAAGLQSHAYSLTPTDAVGEYLKWGESHRAGTSGGVVTWGFVASGTAGSSVCLPYCAGQSLDYLPNYYPTPATGNQTEPLSLLSLREAFQAAFDAWSSVADIRFLYVGVDRSLLPFNDPAAQSPMIRIAIFSFEGQSKYCNAGAAFAPPPNVGTIAGDVFINSNVGYQMIQGREGDKLQSFPIPNGLHMTDLHHLALHETGHAIGLGSSADPDSAMCGQALSIACNRFSYVWHTPRADDIAGVKFLYGAVREQWTPNPSLERTPTGKSLGPPSAVVYAAPCGPSASPAVPAQLKR